MMLDMFPMGRLQIMLARSLSLACLKFFRHHGVRDGPKMDLGSFLVQACCVCTASRDYMTLGDQLLRWCVDMDRMARRAACWSQRLLCMDSCWQMYLRWKLVCSGIPSTHWHRFRRMAGRRLNGWRHHHRSR